MFQIYEKINLNGIERIASVTQDLQETRERYQGKDLVEETYRVSCPFGENLQPLDLIEVFVYHGNQGCASVGLGIRISDEVFHFLQDFLFYTPEASVKNGSVSEATDPVSKCDTYENKAARS